MSEQILQEAAKWIWDRRNSTDWWNHTVLTTDNPDPNTLGIDRHTAFQIFVILKERRLLIPTNVRFEQNGACFTFPAYIINYNKDKEWTDLVTKKGYWKLYI